MEVDEMAEGIGRRQIGTIAPPRPRRGKRTIIKVTRGAELARDRARLRLWEMRQRYKLRVRRGEQEMERRKRERRKSLNPSFLSLMPSRKYAKQLRNPANWSAAPKKPKYSYVKPRERIYGKRFEVWDKKLERKPVGIPEKHRGAAEKMAESVAELREDITKRAKGLAGEGKTRESS